METHLQVNSNYRIRSDAYCLILEERHVNDDKDSENHGKEYWGNPTYHSSLSSAFRKIAWFKVLKNWPDLIKIKNEIMSLRNDVKELDKKLTI